MSTLHMTFRKLWRYWTSFLKNFFNVFGVWLCQVIQNTVYIGFCDQPPSQGSRSLNLIVVAKLSGFSLGLTTRWSLNPMYSILRWVQRPPKVSTVAISLHKGRNQRSLNTRSLCSTKKGPSRRFWSLKPDWPLYPQSQNPMLTVLASRLPQQHYL